MRAQSCKTHNGQVALVCLGSTFFMFKMFCWVWAQINTQKRLSERHDSSIATKTPVVWHHHPHRHLCVHRKWRWKHVFFPPTFQGLGSWGCMSKLFGVHSWANVIFLTNHLTVASLSATVCKWGKQKGMVCYGWAIQSNPIQFSSSGLLYVLVILPL